MASITPEAVARVARATTNRQAPPATVVIFGAGGDLTKRLVLLGKPVRDYRHEPNVAPSSTTETYVALKLGIDNWRWAGVPFYLRTGKYLSARTTEIAIQFRQAPYALFRETPVEALPRNFLTLRIQPDEGLSVTFSAKRPGQEIEIEGVAMDFSYRDYFEPLNAVGYETLLYDCLIGDAMLFSAPTRSRPPGVPCGPCWTPGPPNRPAIFRTTRPAAPGRRLLIGWSHATDAPGCRSAPNCTGKITDD
jgi:glucose-6-phosphate 1-dehydrogenase